MAKAEPNPVARDLLDKESAVRLLESKEEWKREMARSWLEEHQESAGDLILTRLRQEAAKRKRKQRLVYWGFGIYGGVLVTVLLGWLGIGLMTGRWADFPWQLFQAFSYMGIFGSIGAASQFQRSATEVIAQFDDVRFVPDLVDALGYSDKHMNDVSRAALTNLLPRLTASDVELLNSEQRKLLHRWFTITNKEYAFLLAILKGLEQVGDERDLPTVRKLAETDAVNHRLKEVYEAARQCLPYVEQRAEQNRIASTLLRAASSDLEDTGSLLRPASSSAGIDSNGLLRPADSAAAEAVQDHSDSVDWNIVELRSSS